MILLNFMKTSGASISRFFPHMTQRGKAGGSCFSASRLVCICTALLASFATAPANAGNPQIDGQMNQAIQRYLQQWLAKEATSRQWLEMHFSHSDTPLSSSAQLAPCSQPLQVNGGNNANLAHQRLTLACAAPAWTLVVNVEVQVLLPVLFSTQVIERGDSITAAMLKRQEVDVAKAMRGFYQREEQLIGMGAKRRIRENQQLSQELISLPLLVHRGDKVKVVAGRDGIAASVSGEAQENGAEGELIRVKNISSGKNISAKVLEAGLVTSSY